MGIDRRAAFAIGHAAHGLGIADFGVDHVLPAQQAGGFARAGDIHPRRHFRHRAAVDHLCAVKLGDLVAHAGDRGARLAGKEHDFKLKVARIKPLLDGDLRQMQRIGRRRVEGRRLDHVEPLHAARRHAGRAGAERKAFGAKPLGAGERAPASHIERENRGHADAVAGAKPHAPHDAGVRVGDGAPVVASDGKGGGPAGGAAGAVNVENVLLGNAQVVAERRQARLRLA